MTRVVHRANRKQHAAGLILATVSANDKPVLDALGVAGSMASGIIEYLAEGTWTKRMHAGWAAQSGVRAALMARGGFVGPRTVLEGTHGLYRAFAPSVKPDFAPLVDGLGSEREAVVTHAERVRAGFLRVVLRLRHGT